MTKMSRQPTKRENEKFSPICRVYGKTPADCRTLISEGRKVGFILDFGTVPSKHCFVQGAPTQSYPKAPKPAGSLTLVTDGWKIALDVRGTLYLGEIKYNPSDIPLYRFSRFEGDQILDSSDWFDAPTPAFAQISSRLPDKARSQADERPNGKLYMAVQYSEPQQIMRDEFAVRPPKIPLNAQTLFNQWLSVGSSASNGMRIPVPFPSNAPPASPMVRLQQIGAAASAASSGSTDFGSGASRFSHFGIVPVPMLPSSSAERAVVSSSSPEKAENTDLGKKRPSQTSISVEFERLMKVSEPQPVLDNGSPTNGKKLVVIKEVVQDVHNRLSDQTNPRETELITDLFRHPMMEEQSEDTGMMKDVVRLLRADSMDFLEDDLFVSVDRKLSVNMSAQELFEALKHPDSETLTRPEMKRAITTLLQMPIPAALLNATFDACDVERTGKVTLENFVRAINARERDLWNQFRMIDTNGTGEITLDALRAAKANGMFNAQERELNALLGAMDRVSGTSREHASDRKMQWEEFRAMMILLPPATTIQTIVDLVKTSLDEQDELRHALLLEESLPGLQRHASRAAPFQSRSEADLYTLRNMNRQRSRSPPPGAYSSASTAYGARGNGTFSSGNYPRRQPPPSQFAMPPPVVLSRAASGSSRSAFAATQWAKPEHNVHYFQQTAAATTVYVDSSTAPLGRSSSGFDSAVGILHEIFSDDLDMSSMFDDLMKGNNAETARQ